jgi:hypothetical protein
MPQSVQFAEKVEDLRRTGSIEPVFVVIRE